jgi:NADH-quinone oxidoreductase subunit G
MVVHTKSPKAAEAQRTTLEFLLINHPIDCPVCDQAGECYLQDQYMDHGLHDSKVELEDKVRKRKVVDLGPIMLDAERCVLCSRCLRFEREVTGTNSFEFVNRGDHTQIATFDNRPITHDYAGNLADVCPVGALLSNDFRFKMRVWFLKTHESVCPGCSTGCNVFVDERDGGVQRLRPRRNADVNKSWMCDPGRALYKQIGVTSRVSGARVRGAASWEGVSVGVALDRVASALKDAGAASAFLASPQGTNEDVFAFKALAEAVGGKLDFRIGDPHLKVRERIDHVLQRADRNPNTRGCLDQGVGRDGVAAILAACRAGSIRALVLQGPEILRVPEVVDAIAKVPVVTVMATHEGPELDRATVVLPAALWAEAEGTFTNYQRRVQRLKAAVPAPGDALPRWELAAGLLQRLGQPLGAATAREVFSLVARWTPDYASLDYRAIGPTGRALPSAEAAVPAQEARA